MLIIIKHRYYYYRRFQYDIWGLCFLDLRAAEDLKLKDFFNFYGIKTKKKKKILNEEIYGGSS